MIIVDYSTVSIGNYVSQKLPPDIDLLRHTILSSLKSYNLKFRDKYGQMVIACDSSSWRRQYFENYKAKRREAREDDSAAMDWKRAYECFNIIRDELEQILPWPVVKVSGAESDDIIAVLTQRAQEFGTGEPVVVIASDSDYKQLLKFQGVKVWSPITKKFVDEPNPDLWLFEATIKGQQKDGIPSIYSPDDHFLTREKGQRQPTVSAKKLNDLYEAHKRGSLKDTLTERERRNFDRNQTLMSFDKIPDNIRESIIQAYISAPRNSPTGVMNYLIKNRCKVLLDSLNDFIPGKELA
jgi:hypothetical protein